MTGVTWRYDGLVAHGYVTRGRREQWLYRVGPADGTQRADLIVQGTHVLTRTRDHGKDFCDLIHAVAGGWLAVRVKYPHRGTLEVLTAEVKRHSLWTPAETEEGRTYVNASGDVITQGRTGWWVRMAGASRAVRQLNTLRAAKLHMGRARVEAYLP